MNDNTIPPRYLNREQAAAYIGQTPRWFMRSPQGRTIPFTKVGYRCVYDRIELDAWMAAQKTTLSGDA